MFTSIYPVKQRAVGVCTMEVWGLWTWLHDLGAPWHWVLLLNFYKPISSGVPCHSPGDLPDPEIKLMSLMFPALAGEFFITSATWEALIHITSLNFLDNPVKFWGLNRTIIHTLQMSKWKVRDLPKLLQLPGSKARIWIQV